jgi:hypothetical protein
MRALTRVSPNTAAMISGMEPVAAAPASAPQGVLAISRPLASGDICEDYRWTRRG